MDLVGKKKVKEVKKEEVNGVKGVNGVKVPRKSVSFFGKKREKQVALSKHKENDSDTPSTPSTQGGSTLTAPLQTLHTFEDGLVSKEFKDAVPCNWGQDSDEYNLFVKGLNECYIDNKVFIGNIAMRLSFSQKTGGGRLL